MYLDLRAEYEAKAKKADAELTSKGRSLESDLKDYQNKIDKGLVTRSEAMTMQENLEKKQQSFVQHRDKVMNELAEQEQVMLNKIHYNITEYLKEFNSDYRFKIILSTTSGGPVMNADPSLDITQIVLEGLNKKYAAEGKTNKNSEKLSLDKQTVSLNIRQKASRCEAFLSSYTLSRFSFGFRTRTDGYFFIPRIFLYFAKKPNVGNA